MIDHAPRVTVTTAPPAHAEDPIKIFGTIDDDTVCHLYGRYGTDERALCGVPRAEQQKHGFPSPHWRDEIYCPTCGLRRCKRCRGV